MTNKGRKHYGNAIIEEVLQMVSEGKTQREISEYYGFKDKMVVRELIKRHNRKIRIIESGIIPRKIGRPRKSKLRTPEDKDRLIKQLKMENELLRSFLSDAGRR